MSFNPNQIASQIRSLGFRMTPQRMEIISLLCRSEHLTPTEIHNQLTGRFPDFTEPTVYRTLDFLSEKGFIRATHVGNGKMQYELTDKEHHHFLCNRCGARFDIEHESLQSLFDQLEHQTGFKLTEHHLTLNGYCPTCKE